MEGNAVVRWEFGHVGDGLRADSSTRFPGASSLHHSELHCLKVDEISGNLQWSLSILGMPDTTQCLTCPNIDFS
jgi:hypothetical protein